MERHAKHAGGEERGLLGARELVLAAEPERGEAGERVHRDDRRQVPQHEVDVGHGRVRVGVGDPAGAEDAEGGAEVGDAAGLGRQAHAREEGRRVRAGGPDQGEGAGPSAWADVGSRPRGAAGFVSQPRRPKPTGRKAACIYPTRYQTDRQTTGRDQRPTGLYR